MRNRLQRPIWDQAVCASCKMDLFTAKQAEERLARMGAIEVQRHTGCGHPMAYRSGGSVTHRPLEPLPLSR